METCFSGRHVLCYDAFPVGGGVFAAENQGTGEIVVESEQEGEAEDQEKDTLPENPAEGENSGDVDATQEIGSDEAEPKEDGTSEGTETSGEAGGTGETGGDGTQGDSEEDVMPTVEPMTLEYVPGKVVEIPVTMGSGKYKAWDVRVESRLGYGRLGYGSYDSEKGVVRFEMDFWNEEAVLKSGDYEVHFIFWYQDYELDYFENKEDVKIHVGADIRTTLQIPITYITDGSEDLVYRFQNGSGAYELKEFTEGIFLVDNGVFRLTDRNQFTYDLEKGTLTIKGGALKSWLESLDYDNRNVCICFVGNTVQGVEYRFGGIWGEWCFIYEPSTTNPTPTYVESGYEAIISARMQELIEINKEKDVTITNYGVNFIFAKGTMHLVKGVENYAFGVDLVNDYSKSGISNSKVTADNFVLRINFEYSGELPGTAKISIPVDSKWNGKTLYYYQIKSDGTLRDTGKSGEVTDGIFNVEQTHCSDYVLLSSSPKELGVASTQATKAPQTGDSNMVLLYGLLCMGALVVGICTAATRRKSN